MKNVFKNKLFWLVLLVPTCLILLLTKFSDNIEVSKIEKILPQLIGVELKGYFNNGTCKYLEYATHKIKDNCNDRDYPGNYFGRFTEEDWEVFNKIDKLTNSGFVGIGLTMSVEGEVTMATFDRDCFFCGIIYI